MIYVGTYGQRNINIYCVYIKRILKGLMIVGYCENAEDIK